MCLGTRALRISSPVARLALDLEAKVLDDMVGQQLPAHRLHSLPRLVLVVYIEAHLDVLADADVGDLPEAKRRQSLLDRDSLRVVDDRLGGHYDLGYESHGRNPRREIRCPG